MRSQFGVRIAFGPMLETAQIEMLILERMGELMRHDRLLPIEIDPVSQIKLARFRIVIAGHLFRQYLDYQRPVLKIGRCQSEFFQRDFVSVHFRRSYVFIEVLNDRSLDLRA